MSYDCGSILKHVLKCMRQKSYRVNRPFRSFYNVLYTLPLFVRRHRLLERGIHTFPCLFVGAGSGVYTLSLFGTAFWNEAYTLPLFVCRHRPLERGIHTSPLCSSAQAFRTRDTHFPLFVCRCRLRGIYTFAFRHGLLERGVHTSPVCLSAQAFRTRDTHFPLFVCRRRLRGIRTFSFRHRLLE